MFNPTYYENARPDGVAVLEVVAPDEEKARPRLFVPLKESQLSGAITGPLAELTLIQTFGYTRDQHTGTLEAVYRFPLPGDAAVVGVRVRFGAVEIVAELKERSEAQQKYEEAKEKGQQAALLTRETASVFTLHVAGLQPDQEIVVETHYVQLAQVAGAGWSLRVPLTTAPRYVREDEGGSRAGAGQPLAVLRDPGHRFALDIMVRGASSVASPTHELDVVHEDVVHQDVVHQDVFHQDVVHEDVVHQERNNAVGDARVRLLQRTVIPDRDCVLTWQPRQTEKQPTLRVFCYHDEGKNYVYFLAQVAPPTQRISGSGVPRAITLLVDHSGSMEGAKWSATDWTIERFLSDLQSHDVFALGLFHSATTWFEDRLTPADEETVRRAIRFAQANRDSGGTNLGVALEQALAIPTQPGKRARHVLIVTDAQVTDEGRILRLADGEAARQDGRRRISVLCIDAAPNAFLAQELAVRGGGVAHFLTSAPEADDITTALDEVLADWSEPVLSDLRLGVNRMGVESTGQDVEERQGWSLIDVGDLPMGRAVWLAGRIPADGADDLCFELQTVEDATLAHVEVALTDNATPALKALFGVRRINGLEHLITAGYGPEELAEQLRRLGYVPSDVLDKRTEVASALYSENRQQETRKLLQGLLVQEALSYGLASSETSFVAVRKEAGKRIDGTVAVANALPAGWSASFDMSSMAMPTRLSTGASRGSVGTRSAMSAAPEPGIFLPDVSPMPAMNPMPSLGAVAGSGSAGGRVEYRTLFDGVPTLVGSEAVLFDSTENDRGPSGRVTMTGLRLTFPARAPDASTLGREVELLLYVDDLAVPRARVRLVDLLRTETRPLNLLRREDTVLRVVLRDPNGAAAGMRMKVEIAW